MVHDPALAIYVERIDDLSLDDFRPGERDAWDETIFELGYEVVEHWMRGCYGKKFSKRRGIQILGGSCNFKWLTMEVLLRQSYLPNLTSLALSGDRDLYGPQYNLIRHFFKAKKHYYLTEDGRCRCRICTAAKHLRKITLNRLPLEDTCSLMVLPSIEQITIKDPHLVPHLGPRPYQDLHMRLSCVYNLPLSQAREVISLSRTKWRCLDVIARCFRGPCTIVHQPSQALTGTRSSGPPWSSVFVPRHCATSSKTHTILATSRSLMPPSQMAKPSKYDFVEDPLASELAIKRRAAMVQRLSKARLDQGYVPFIYRSGTPPIKL